MQTIGIDIGGANLKLSDGERQSLSVPFAMWQHPEKLAERLSQVLQRFDESLATGRAHPDLTSLPNWASRSLAVTMTGELADCFRTKQEGVHTILDAVVSAAQGASISVWQSGGEFCSVEEARELVPLVAAANWHALATWVGRLVPAGRAILLDIGSTTTDVIPIEDGLPIPTGRTDLERLQSGELLYAGVRRTPLAAFVHSLTLNGAPVPLAAELFATTLDVYLLTGDHAEVPNDTHTANGRGSTVAEASRRLARMLCCDETELDQGEIRELALQARQHQTQRTVGAIRQVCQATWDYQSKLPAVGLILSGEGEFLSRLIVESGGLSFLQLREVHSLTNILGPVHSSAACSYALARLLRAE